MPTEQEEALAAKSFLASARGSSDSDLTAQNQLEAHRYRIRYGREQV